MRVASHQRRAAVPEQAGDSVLCIICHGEPAGERVAQRVPPDTCQPQLLDRQQIVPLVKVARAHMGRRVLARKHPYRKLPALQSPQEHLSLFVGPDILHPACLGRRPSQDATLQVSLACPTGLHYAFPVSCEVMS